jgi:uncharacterized membrane protein
MTWYFMRVFNDMVFHDSIFDKVFDDSILSRVWSYIMTVFLESILWRYVSMIVFCDCSILWHSVNQYTGFSKDSSPNFIF